MTRTRAWPLPVLWVAAAAALGTGCGGGGQSSDPVAVAVVQYKSAVEPVLQKSEEVSKIFVQIVLEDKGKPDPDRAAKRIETEVIPRAKTFYDDVSAIKPSDPNIAEIHKFLVQVAKLRLEGYQSVIKGYSENDLELFTEGKKMITESKIQENTFIDRAGQFMRAYGQKLVYFAPGSQDTMFSQ